MVEKASISVTRGPNDTEIYLEGDYIDVTLNVPGYDGSLELKLSVERDIDGDWRVFIPFPDRILEDDATWRPTEGKEFRLPSNHGGVNGIVYMGAPD